MQFDMDKITSDTARGKFITVIGFASALRKLGVKDAALAHLIIDALDEVIALNTTNSAEEPVEFGPEVLSTLSQGYAIFCGAAEEAKH